MGNVQVVLKIKDPLRIRSEMKMSDDKKRFETWPEWDREDTLRYRKVLKCRKILEGAERNYEVFVWDHSLKPLVDRTGALWNPETGDSIAEPKQRGLPLLVAEDSENVIGRP